LSSARDHGIATFPEERGASYEENALVKAGYVALATGLPSLGDDSGLEVDALEGAPGIYSARFGGALTSGERIAHLLSRLRGVPKDARGATFVCSLVVATPSGQLQTFRGECRGQILEGPRGESGFGYDPIFYSPELRKTFAEASEEEKRRVSHRGRALQAFVDWAHSDNAKKTMREREAPKEANL
ncbi:MAG TPA: RdgB/HAM1 family non-canonical purine NTP pyrophosphatase, partial [Trueperaceae bacterium]